MLGDELRSETEAGDALLVHRLNCPLIAHRRYRFTLRMDQAALSGVGRHLPESDEAIAVSQTVKASSETEGLRRMVFTRSPAPMAVANIAVLSLLICQVTAARAGKGI